MSSNGSNPRSPRPVAAVRRHAALIVASGSLLVGLLVLTGIALDERIAAGQSTPVAVPAVDLVDLADPSAPPVVTDTMGEHAAVLTAFFEARAAADRAASAARPSRPAVVVNPDDPGVWDRLAQCEAGGNWASDSAAGYSGGLGFAHSTWTANGGGEFAAVAADATREQQIIVAQRVQASSGWGAWPGCSSLLGLR